MSISGLLEQSKRSESKIYGVVAGIIINNRILIKWEESK